MQDLRDQLLAQEFINEQFSDVVRAPLVPVAQLDAGGAISGIVSNTLVIGGKTGTTQNVEMPQPLAPTSSPRFSTVNCAILNPSNDPASRANLGLGNLSTQNAAAASADTAPAQGVAYVQADVQAILNELRDLKSKLRTAGILTP